MGARREKRLAVLGHPVAHSRSPAMQNAALEQLGLGATWSYEAIDVTPEAFDEFVRGMEADRFVGANVTVPHKLAAFGLADSAGPAATAIGAANTLSFEAGRIVAENTDGPGLVDALPIDPAGSRALLIGAGGAARAALWALVNAGADVVIWNRTASRAVELAAELGGEAVVEPDAGEFDLIVNSSAAGLGGGDPFPDLPLAPDRFRGGQVVVDLVYGASPSRLIESAAAAGALTVDGLEILVRQGARSLAIWTGLQPSLEVMREAAARRP
ncbi:MAG: shikimate dehydrogenase [Solirubrobacterales bacterium]|nr:shikimate dehydrogenase [Solirubrobacterales bacterium]